MTDISKFIERFNSDSLNQRLQVEKDQGWRDIVDSIPFIQFPAGWKFRAVPPFLDAVVRFHVELPNGDQKSIYLDSRDTLGSFGDSPYWEVYPVEGDARRCAMNDTESLLALIAAPSAETKSYE